MCGGVPVIVNSSEENGFMPSSAQIENAITDKTIAIIVNTPCNPTGVVFDHETLTMIADIAKKHDIAFYRRKNGQFVLHRVMRMCSDGTYIMCGDNQTFLEKGIEATQIIAYVSEIYRKEKKIDIGGFWYSLYVFFWTKMPLRKAVIFTKRAIAKMGRICKRTFSKHID